MLFEKSLKAIGFFIFIEPDFALLLAEDKPILINV
jgi:hypothetical protein